MRFRSLPVLLLMLVLNASFAEAKAPPTLAVLYFDNTAHDASLDPLRKGFADMLITDLAQMSGWRIVEREKLESLVKEIKLANSGFIDAKTAGKLGHGLGAQYLLTGAFLHVGGQLRLDVRLMRVKTGEIALADQIQGPDKNVFELERQLVGKIASNLDAALPENLSAKWAQRRPASIQLVAAYGQAIDAGDHGDLDGARQQLRDLLQSAPGLDFASIRLDQVEELERRSAMTRNVKLPADIIEATKKARRGNATACNEVISKLGTVFMPVTMGINTFHMSEHTALSMWKRAGLATKPTDIDDMRHQVGAQLYVMFRLANYVLEAQIPEKVCGVDAQALSFLVLGLGAAQTGAPKPTMYDADGKVAIAPEEYDRLIVKYGNDYLQRYPTGVWATTIPTFLDPAAARLKEASGSPP